MKKIIKLHEETIKKVLIEIKFKKQFFKTIQNVIDYGIKFIDIIEKVNCFIGISFKKPDDIKRKRKVGGKINHYKESYKIINKKEIIENKFVKKIVGDVYCLKQVFIYEKGDDDIESCEDEFEI